MYITITKQTLGGNHGQSVSDFVAYLEKENEGKAIDEMEHFFNQNGEEISRTEVIQEIDKNTSKLKKTEPKFYSITVNPSAYELKHLQDHSEELKMYTRELMKEYAKSFNREIDGRSVTVKDIKYYAKIEHQRTFKGTDKQIQENQPYATKILELKNDIRSIELEGREGSVKKLQDEILQLEKTAPHQQGGKRIVQGMPKEGSQSHIHIVVSRKDMSNKYSLSPGSKYKASETVFNGKLVKRGFDRDKFFKASEKKFDTLFKYKRNYVETYKARKILHKNPKLYFSILSGLPTNQKAVAYKILANSGVAIMKIPTNQVQLALKVINRFKKGLDIALKSGSIGI